MIANVLLTVVVVALLFGGAAFGWGAFSLANRALDGWLDSLDRLLKRVEGLETRVREVHDSMHTHIDQARLELQTEVMAARNDVKNLHTAMATDFQAPDLADDDHPPTLRPSMLSTRKGG